MFLYTHFLILVVRQVSPGESVPHHQLGSRWELWEAQQCEQCGGGDDQDPEEDWQPYHHCPLQVSQSSLSSLAASTNSSSSSSDTVSRSGMFCAIATTIERCKTEGVVDVFQVVKALRVQKPGAVRTVVGCHNSGLFSFSTHK